MKINAIDIKPGNVLEYQNKLWLVLKRELVSPARAAPLPRSSWRDLRGGQSSTSAFAPGDRRARPPR
jgi:elongation factor P